MSTDPSVLVKALEEARNWHESQDKVLSKSGRGDASYHYFRNEHRTQIEEIDQALTDYKAGAAPDIAGLVERLRTYSGRLSSGQSWPVQSAGQKIECAEAMREAADALSSLSRTGAGLPGEEIEKIAAFFGELCGAAHQDYKSADPADVGMNGVPIKQWRKAYFEGCNDMASGITARLPEEHHERIKKIARAAFTKAFEAAGAAAKETVSRERNTPN